MIEINGYGDALMLVLKKGDDLIPTLTEWIKKQNIRGGEVSGIGALEEVCLGYYDLPTKNYQKRTFEGEYELLNLSGNISLVDDEVFIHLHAQLSDADYNCIGGHLFSGKVSITGEIFVRPLGAMPTRSLNKDIGLNLIDGDL